MPTHFKLKFSDLTRKVSFAKQPTWQELSEKISTLYSIPRHQVGVTYIDAEDEEITLNTEEELQDYYSSSYRSGETIKFSVWDLASRKQGQIAPTNTGFRNTFGQFVDPEIPGIDEWQAVNNIPSLEEILGHTSITSDVRSAFVESVASEGSTVGKAANNTLGEGMETIAGDARSEISEPRVSGKEKGKERAYSLHSTSSTQSLLAADNGDKHPVHVYDVSSHSRSPLIRGFSFGDGEDAIPAESTPRVSTSSLEQGTTTVERKPDQTQEFEDPPLPSLESTDPRTAQTADDTQSAQSARASASLARDVAAFLNAISSVVSTHPELGESLRTIVRNTTNGTYWASHREVLSQAAAEIQRSTENLAEDGRRVVEEEAGRRIAEALSGVLHIFSQSQAGMANTQADGNTQSSDKAADSNAQQTDTANVPPSNDSNPPPDPSRSQSPPLQAFSPNFGVNFGRSFPFNYSHRPALRGGWRARASMPPNFPFGGGYPAWAMPPAHPVFGPGVLNATGPTTSSATGTAPPFNNDFRPASGPHSTTNPDQTLNPEASSGNESHERPSAQELKAKVEEAKRAYKAEKERYRRERDERKTEKDKEHITSKEGAANTSQNPDVTMSSGEDVHIASHARHGFPRFDIVNVTDPTPQRHNTHVGHFPRRYERPTEDLFTRAVNRISKRLAVMGFTEKAYPDLRQKIKNHLPSDGAIAKDSEDDIVTSLLEAMLSAPKSPVASGSGARDIPGGWH
ncbi:hypothetical protein D9756_005943 [Leucocoprinus leucothites]|uniref:PB1 domain-containing protein n=1 Tax=Leucocoprinus leucothites TaxID=201217 RepID=A0A8H5FXB8_9AGAR|nr:hypothetical protein D9756_005943 [Leucoagaricus leucothites]